jgi:hypothetical protein
MPPAIIGAAVTAGLGAAAGITMFGLTVAQTAILSFVANVALGFVAQALSPKPKIPNLSSFAAKSRDRVQQFRQPITLWKSVYGEVRISGPLTFVETTKSNKFIHMVITLAAHEVQAIEDVFLDDAVITSDQLDSNGLVTSGKYANKVRIQKDLGGGTGQPFPSLASATTSWTDDHRQTGRAKIYVRMEYDKDIFPKSPNFSAWVKGKKVADPRNSSTVAWTTNPALIIRDYLTTSTTAAGAGATTIEINDTFTNAAANTSDEIVSTVSIIASVTSANASTNVMTLVGSTSRFFTGDRMEVSTVGGAVPTGLVAGSVYYAIPTQRHTSTKLQFASTYANAITGTAVAISDAGTAPFSVKKTGEPRYTLNGVFEADEQPSRIITEMLTALGGRAVYASGAWRVLAGVYAAPSLAVDEDDFIAPIQVQTKQSRSARFNAVKGIYVSVLNLDQPSDYPPITNSTYETEDNGERIFRELDLPHTNRPHMAQRLAKIELERHRQQITATSTLSLKGIQIQAGDTVSVTNSRFGWSAKVFEVTEWKLAAVGDPPAIGCDVSLREIASDVFDWNSGLETLVDPAPNTELLDIYTVGAPENLVITETLYDTRGSAGVKTQVKLAWTAPSDVTLSAYLVEKQQTQDKDGNAVTESYTEIAAITDTSTEVVLIDVEPGIYNYRVRAVSIWGVRSPYVEKTGNEIFGLLAAPTEPQNLTISAIGGIAFLRWDATPDLDVKVGGTYLFRHSRVTSGALWQQSVGVGLAIPGSESTVSLPLKAGTYLVKAVDSSGIESTSAATVTTKQATAAAFTTTSTITESTTFPGSTTNIAVGGGVMTLVGSGLVDSIADIDSVANWDSYGGIVSSGTYVFSAAFDWGSVVSKRYTSDIAAAISNVNDLIDSRTANIDDWADFDGDTAGSADARMYSSHTDDDPSGSPTWTSYDLLESAEIEARGVRFKTVLTTADPAYNIEVSVLSVVAETAT